MRKGGGQRGRERHGQRGGANKEGQGGEERAGRGPRGGREGRSAWPPRAGPGPTAGARHWRRRLRRNSYLAARLLGSAAGKPVPHQLRLPLAVAASGNGCLWQWLPGFPSALGAQTWLPRAARTPRGRTPWSRGRPASHSPRPGEQLAPGRPRGSGGWSLPRCRAAPPSTRAPWMRRCP